MCDSLWRHDSLGLSLCRRLAFENPEKTVPIESLQVRYLGEHWFDRGLLKCRLRYKRKWLLICFQSEAVSLFFRGHHLVSTLFLRAKRQKSRTRLRARRNAPRNFTVARQRGSHSNKKSAAILWVLRCHTDGTKMMTTPILFTTSSDMLVTKEWYDFLLHSYQPFHYKSKSYIRLRTKRD